MLFQTGMKAKLAALMKRLSFSTTGTSYVYLCGITWGLFRTDKRLERALRRIQMLQQETHEYYSNFKVSNNLLELRNLLQVAELMVRCAMQRKESRGLHYTLDYPDMLENSGPTILTPSE